MSKPQAPAMVDRVGDRAAQDVVALLDGVPLTTDEAEYVEAARAANTLRGYRSDWREFASWCTQHGVEPMAAAPATVTGYLSDLARHGAKVGTMSRRLSAIKFAHQMQNLSDPTRNARVVAVWEGIRVLRMLRADRPFTVPVPAVYFFTGVPTLVAQWINVSQGVRSHV